MKEKALAGSAGWSVAIVSRLDGPFFSLSPKVKAKAKIELFRERKSKLETEKKAVARFRRPLPWPLSIEAGLH